MAQSAAKEDALRQIGAGTFPRRLNSISHVKHSATPMDVQAPLSRAALNNLSAGIVIIDSGGEIIFSNRCWRTKVRPDIFPFPECEHTTNYLELWSGYGGDSFRHDTHTLISGLTNIFSGNQDGFKHGLTLPSLQEQKWYDCEIAPFEFNDNLHAVITHRDVSRFRQAEREIEWMAYHDPLTGLRNRNLFDVHLEQSLARANRDKTNAALLFFDLDSFKAINDTLGHPSGDLLLKAVAERLALRIRKSDTLVRYGGDEFIVILNNCDEQAGISVVARNLLKTLRAPYMLNGEEMYISASIGIARYPADAQNAGQLLSNADIAMYHAKKQGGNAFLFYRPEMNKKARKKIKWETALHHAIENRELCLHYQPYLDLLAGKLSGIEALIRWNHPGLGLVPPARFIPLAEETGLIIPIGEWVLDTACRQVKILRAHGFDDVRVAVNVSGRQFRHYDLAEVVARIIAQHGIPPGALELELTESAIMENSQATIRAMKKLKDMGVFLTLDDFGTGYSSLSYLKRFPMDKLKIDRSFIRDIPVDKESMALTKAIIAMAHSLRLGVIAEGVENAEQVNFLLTHGCTTAQGYHISRPLPDADLLVYLRQRKEMEKSCCMFDI